MKLSIDFDYILKRLIVVVLAFVIISQLKSCDVHAETYYNAQFSSSNSSSVIYYYSGTSLTSSNVSWSTYNNLFGSGLQSQVINASGAYNSYLRITLSGIYSNFTNYDNFSFLLGSYVPLSGGVGTAYFGGYCVVENNSDYETGVQSSSGSLFNNGFYVYRIHCTYSSISNQTYLTIPVMGSNISQLRFAISSYWSYWKSDSVSSSINNQSQQQHEDSQAQQQAINDVNNSLNDNTVSSSTNNAGGSIFNIQIDTGHGLTSIITAPLALLQRSQEKCTSKSFTIFGKSITIPCGDDLFWSKDFSSYHSIFGSGFSGSQLNTVRDNFRTFWNVLFGGAIIMALLIKLWTAINVALDPMADSYTSLSDAIDTGKSVRDTDGDVILGKPDMSSSVRKARSGAAANDVAKSYVSSIYDR